MLELRIAGEAMDAVDIPDTSDTWRVELSNRFVEVMVPPNR
jgi:hypothetical protein